MSITVFGGGAVQTAYVSFTALDITLNSITLVWPTSYFNVPSVVNNIHYDVLAASFTVTTGALNANTITLPNATESSIGSNFIVTNVGASSFRLLKSNGDELIVVPNGPNNPLTGTATLAAGTVTVNTSAVVAGSNIQVTRNTPGGGLGNLSVPSASIIPNTSFVINSTDLTETSTLDWFISNPLSYNSFWVQLIDNSTPEGTWQFIQFGAGTSQAQASDLAGNGLVALGNFLNTNITVKSISNTPYNVSVSDRAKLLLWQTGAGQMNLPLIASVPSGFYISINNEGSGILTISGNTTIDNKVSISVSPGQSLSLISDGSKWWSLGFGQNIASSNFIPGSPIAPSITFTNDSSTGIYYSPPQGVGISVNSSAIASFFASGLFMNSGNNIVLQDSTNVAQTSITSNVSYGQLSWTSSGLLNPPVLNISGTNTLSSLTLGPFGTFSITQDDTNAILSYALNDFLVVDTTGNVLFPFSVGFSQDMTVNGTATFVGPFICNNSATFNSSISVTGTATFSGSTSFNDPVTFSDTSTFNGDANFNGNVTLSTPLQIADGGTNATTQQSALNNLMPSAPAIGDLLYYDATNNWVRLPIGNPGDTLKVVTVGINNVPQWVP